MTNASAIEQTLCSVNHTSSGCAMINVGMIDIDLLNSGTRHPNLAQMKMSGYYKKIPGFNVKLLYRSEQLNDLKQYDYLLVSKVFNFTSMPHQLLSLMNDLNETISSCHRDVYTTINDGLNGKPDRTILLFGGTGFYDDKSPKLNEKIEFIMPDYHLYDEYVEYKINSGWKRSYFNDYLNYSIGFTTRGCIRRCSFCVNRNSKGCIKHSDISEFYDPSRKGIYLWDDNFFAYKGDWESILDSLDATGKPYQFRQGLDIRLLDRPRAKRLATAHYHGDFIFAFDHIQDRKIIVKQLKIWRDHCKKETKLYLLCAYDPYTCDPKFAIKGDYTQDEKDIIDLENTFERIFILMRFGCLPYIMRFETYKSSKYRGVYTQLARWCNQPAFFKKLSFKEYCLRNQDYAKTDRACASVRALNLLLDDAPHLQKYLDLKFLAERSIGYEGIS